MSDSMDFRRAATVKKTTAAVLASMVISFVLFVFARNDWAIDVNNMSGAVKKALGTLTVAEQQETILQQLDVTPAEVFKQKLKDGTIVTVVTGEIQNTSRYPMEKVLVEGRLLDGTKAVRTTTTAIPCGKSHLREQIARLKKTELISLYKEGEQPFNCIIKSGFSAPFTVIFDALPDSFNSTFKFEVHPHSGQFLE